MDTRGGPSRDDNRNLIIAMVLAMVVLLGWDLFYARPQRERIEAERAQSAQQQAAAVEAGETAAAPPAVVSREEALASTNGARIAIDTPELNGSIRLEGARLDDLSLKRFRQAVDPDSPEVALLSPRGARGGYDAFFGWQARERDSQTEVTDSFTPWTAPDGATLTPATPVTLTFESPDGLRFERTISVDENFMFTTVDTVTNSGAAARDLRPYGVVRRQDMPLDYVANAIVHQGMTGVFGPERHLREVKYDDARKHARDKERGRAGQDERIVEMTGQGGWLGISDHYWLTALIPAQNEEMTGF
ncbi:MAG: membrane protein insertase YidC, partial [Hyphomonadaceae bacterium]|nr:membrane protein insertase YidC [Hyphomonadaceae bacterium]